MGALFNKRWIHLDVHNKIVSNSAFKRMPVNQQEDSLQLVKAFADSCILLADNATEVKECSFKTTHSIIQRRR